MSNFKETVSRLARLSSQHGSSDSMPGYLHHLLGMSQWKDEGWTAGAVNFEMPYTREIPEFFAKSTKAKFPTNPRRRLVKYGGISEEGLLFPDTQVPPRNLFFFFIIPSLFWKEDFVVPYERDVNTDFSCECTRKLRSRTS